MWSRKELKRKGRNIIKRQYWRCIAVCFLLTAIAGSYKGTFSAIEAYDSSKEIVNVVMENNVAEWQDVNYRFVKEKFYKTYDEKYRRDEEAAGNTPYKEGVFAKIFNYTMATGSVFSAMFLLLLRPILQGAWLSLAAAASGAIVLLFWSLFVKNILKVGGCRYFMESETYNEVGVKRMLFLYRINREWNCALIMLKKTLYQTLWNLTIVGGVIKHYSYLMVPYLAAENPDLKSSEAIRISRQMMDGNKWNAFKLDLSFLGWELLSICTLGISNILYGNAYKAGTRAELYLTLRRDAIELDAPYEPFFTDCYLTEFPTQEEVRRGLERSIILDDDPDWRQELAAIKNETFDVAREYPGVLFTVPTAERRINLHIDYKRAYGVTGYILLFFIGSIGGWLWEVGLHLAQTGEFVNRGTLFGPWLPIYGFGGVFVLIVLKKLRDHPVATFFSAIVICGIIEYVTSYVLEKMHGGVRWWDYSGYFLQLNGRVCAEGLLVFGIGCWVFIYLLAPLIMGRLEKIPVRARAVLCTVLAVFFLADLFYSVENPNIGTGITSNRHLENIESESLESRQ